MVGRVVEIPEPFLQFGRPARYKGAFGGRGGGKTQNISKMLVARAWERPRRILCGRELQKSIKESVKHTIEKEIFNLGMNENFKKLETEIVGRNGSQFLFTGLRTNPEAVQSFEDVDICWLEEASKISRNSWRILTPTIRNPGSEIWCSWNPKNPEDPVDEHFRGEHGAPPGSVIINVNYYDNPWFPQDLRKEMEWDRRRVKDDFAHVWLGGYLKRSDARVFNNWTVEEFDTPPNAKFHFGADWGFANDPSVLIRCFRDGRKIYFDQEAWKIGCRIEDLPDLFNGVEQSKKWEIRADNARPETIDYVRRHGFPKIVRSLKGTGSVEDGIEFLKSYDLVVHPRCRHLSQELLLYSWKIDRLTEEVLPILEDKNNHVIDAARYAVENVRRAYKKQRHIGMPMSVYVH